MSIKSKIKKVIKGAARRYKSFTLIETFVILIIVGIFTAIALPNYLKTQESALSREAKVNLKLIAAVQKIYRQNYKSYYPSSGTETDLGNINTYLKLSLTDKNWDYSITGGPSSFTVYADRKGADGYLDCQYSFADNDPDEEPDSNASCP